ncbi:MAG: hypothetical protein WD315_01315, partial [Balneolaceae bacterium]
MNINRLAVWVFLGLMAGLWASCTGDSRAHRSSTAVVVELADMEKPMPLISESSLDNELQGIMYRSLLAPVWEEGRLIYQTAEESPMALAKSYEFFGPDSSSLRYHLRT